MHGGVEEMSGIMVSLERRLTATSTRLLLLNLMLPFKTLCSAVQSNPVIEIQRIRGCRFADLRLLLLLAVC